MRPVLIARALIIGLLATVLVPFSTVLVPFSAHASTTNWSFNLVSPNFATATSAPSPVKVGDTIRLTGSGSFDTLAVTITGSGSFTHYNTSGEVIAHGTWTAVTLVGFTPFGGPNPGLQGGVVTITVNQYVGGELRHAGVRMTVTCPINQPGGYVEGTTLGPFTAKVKGDTLFHKNG